MDSFRHFGAVAATINSSPIDSVFFVGLAIGLIVGGIAGFLIALRTKRPETPLTALHIFAVLTFFGYILVSFAFERDVSWIIAIAILATGYGAKGGAIIEKALEKVGTK